MTRFLPLNKAISRPSYHQQLSNYDDYQESGKCVPNLVGWLLGAGNGNHRRDPPPIAALAQPLLHQNIYTRLFTLYLHQVGQPVPTFAPDSSHQISYTAVHWNQLLQHQMLNSKLLSEKSLLIQYLHQYLLQANLQLPTKDIICSLRDIFFRIQYFCNTFDSSSRRAQVIRRNRPRSAPSCITTCHALI